MIVHSINKIHFWCNVEKVRYCLEKNNVSERYSVKTIGKGYREVYLYVFDISNDEFIKKYGNSMTCDKFKIYLTKGKFNNISPFYVSVKTLS